MKKKRMKKIKKFVPILVLFFILILTFFYNYKLQDTVEEQSLIFFNTGNGSIESIFVYNNTTYSGGDIDYEPSLTGPFNVYLEPGQSFNGSFIVVNNFNEEKNIEFQHHGKYSSIVSSDVEDIVFPNIAFEEYNKLISSQARNIFNFTIDVPKTINPGEYTYEFRAALPSSKNNDNDLIDVVVAIGKKINIIIVEDSSLYEEINIFDEINAFSKAKAFISLKEVLSYSFGFMSLFFIFIFLLKKK